MLRKYVSRFYQMRKTLKNSFIFVILYQLWWHCLLVDVYSAPVSMTLLYCIFKTPQIKVCTWLMPFCMSQFVDLSYWHWYIPCRFIYVLWSTCHFVCNHYEHTKQAQICNLLVLYNFSEPKIIFHYNRNTCENIAGTYFKLGLWIFLITN